MDETKRVVIENYPVENLPEDLRGEIDPSHRVRVTVEDASDPVNDSVGRFRRHFGAAKHRNTSVDEAVDRIRTLRDEWEE